jgi:hypothetical protein
VLKLRYLFAFLLQDFIKHWLLKLNVSCIFLLDNLSVFDSSSFDCRLMHNVLRVYSVEVLSLVHEVSKFER